MEILLTDSMRAIENASETAGVSCAVLMQNAGEAAARRIAEGKPFRSCIVLCGPGNNGGDGLVCAAALFRMGHSVSVCMVCGEGKTPLALDARKAAREAGVPFLTPEECEREILYADLVVDAIFGAGFHGSLTGEAARLCMLLTGHGRIVSIDVPSGISADSPVVDGVCISASETFCLHAAKAAAYLLPAAERFGRVTVLPIGVPKEAEPAAPQRGISLTAGEACALLPPRRRTANKGDFGRLLIAAGCARYRGAASLAANAALRCGAGIVTLASVEPVLTAAAQRVWEATFLPLRQTEQGTISRESVPLLLAESAHATVLLAGCGLGNDADTSALVRALIDQAACPLVLDADALNVLAGETSLLLRAKRTPVLTPHVGEMARLTGRSVPEIKRDPVAAALRFAKEHRAVVALKDASTVVASADGRFCLVEGGCPGLARGGSGDTLAGMTASFLAQGMDPFDAASAACTLHAEAGKRLAERRSAMGMLPHELSDALCEIFLENHL